MKSGKRILSMLMAAAMVMAMLPATLLAGNASDVEGHWAQAAIEKWTGYGVLSGYEDGTFRPEKLITRAEVAKILDSMLGYQELGDISFTDVPADAWYSASVQRLATAGVMQGAAGQVRPNDNITRQEAVSLIARAFQIGEGTATEPFVDEASVASWALEAVQNMKDGGYIRGDENGFRPTQPIKRAELITIINNLFAAYYNQAGTYSDAAATGNVAVAADGVVLKDMEIAGDLYVLQGVGEGDARFENVTVKGKTYVWGGGANTVYFLGSSLNQLTADKEGVRVVLDGGSAGLVDVPAGTAQLRGAAEVDALNVGENGVASVAAEATVETAAVNGGQLENQGAINQLTQEGGAVVNSGTLENATLSGDASFESKPEGKIGQLTVGEETGTGAAIKLDSPVKTLTVDAPVAITGGGKIDTANVNADGVAFDTKPAEIKTGADVTVPPTSEKETPAPGGDSGGGDSGYTPVPVQHAVEGVAIEKIEGAIRAGQMLTAVVAPANATSVRYQWYVANDADKEGAVLITGATGSTYTLTKAEAGKYVFVKVQAAKSSEAVSEPVSVAALSTVAAVTEVKVTSKAAEPGAEDTYSVELAFSVDLDELTKDDFVIETADSHATISEVVATDEAKTAWTFTVTAEDGETKITYTITVTKAGAASDNAEVASIAVKDVAATAGEGNTYTVELPHGTVLTELSDADIVITTAHEMAIVSSATTEDEGVTWTFTVTPESGEENEINYTLTVTIAAEKTSKQLEKISGIIEVTIEEDEAEAEAIALAIQAAQLQVEAGYTVTFAGTYDAGEGKLTGKFTVTNDSNELDKATDVADREITVVVNHKYAVTFDNPAHGTLKAKVGGEDFTSGDKALPGTTITFTAEPADDYLVEKWIVNNEVQTGYSGETFEYTVGKADAVIAVVLEEDGEIPISGIIAAPMVDQALEADPYRIDKNAMPAVGISAQKASSKADVIDITLKLVEPIPVHQNAEGKMGAWVGVAIPAPGDVEDFKYYFDSESAGADLALKDGKVDVIAGENYAVFYTNISDLSPKIHIAIQWGAEPVQKYKLNISGLEAKDQFPISKSDLWGDIGCVSGTIMDIAEGATYSRLTQTYTAKVVSVTDQIVPLVVSGEGSGHYNQYGFWGGVQVNKPQQQSGGNLVNGVRWNYGAGNNSGWDTGVLAGNTNAQNITEDTDTFLNYYADIANAKEKSSGKIWIMVEWEAGLERTYIFDVSGVIHDDSLGEFDFKNTIDKKWNLNADVAIPAGQTLTIAAEVTGDGTIIGSDTSKLVIETNGKYKNLEPGIHTWDGSKWVKQEG